MCVFCPVVEAFLPAVLDTGYDRTLGCGIVFQLIGDQHTRRTLLFSHQFAQQALGRFLVAPSLDEDIPNKAVLLDRTPEPVLLAGNGDDHLVQVPFIATTGATPTDAMGKFLAEFQAASGGSSRRSP